MNNDFKRLWKTSGAVAAYALGAAGLLGAAGAMYYIGIAYWMYILFALVAFSIWFLAGLIVTRKDRARKAL
jgi:Na+/proline symporter